MNISEALPTFVVTLREGVEAALVVGIVLACLKKSQQSRLNPWVYGGVGGGILTSVFVGVLLSGLIQGVASSQHPYAPLISQLLQVTFSGVAIVMLSWMLIWMTQQAKSMKAEVEGAINAAISQTKMGAGWGVFSLIFIAVLREGFETVLFIVAKFQQGFLPALGALIGLMMAAGFGVLLFKWGVKINIRLFFQVMGVFLLLIVSGLVVSALKHLNIATEILAQIHPEYAGICFSNASCILGPMVWDAREILPDQKFPGILLKSLLGYQEKLYLAQAISYSVFLITVGGLYFQSLTDKKLKTQPSTAIK